MAFGGLLSRHISMHKQLNRTDLRISFREVSRGHERGVPTMLAYLKDDPPGFGSGYAKEAAWRLLKRVRLSDQQKAMLLEIGRMYLHRRVEREFRYMALTVRRVAGPEFRNEIERLGLQRADRVGARARLLAAYLRDPREGRRLQDELRQGGTGGPA